MIKGKTVLITGGSGFIGSSLVKKLVNSNRVYVIDKAADSNQKAKHIIGRYHDQGLLSSILPKTNIVYHLAWNTTPASGHSFKYEQLHNVNPTLKLIQQVKAYKVPKLIFISTAGAVYGSANPPFTENTKPKPISNHGKAKLKVEQILQSNSQNISFSILRPTNVIGSEQKLNHNQGVIPAIISCLRSGQEFELWGNSHKDYLAVDDLVTAFVLAAQKPSGQIFNVGSGIILSVTDIIDLVEQATGSKLKFSTTISKPHDINRLEVSTKKIRSQLKWKPKTNIKKLIQKIATQQL